MLVGGAGDGAGAGADQSGTGTAGVNLTGLLNIDFKCVSAGFTCCSIALQLILNFVHKLE